MGMFTTIPTPRVKKSVFNRTLSFENKLSFEFGQIVPFFAKDLLPGDNFYFSPEVFMRCAPLIFPMMQLCDVHIDVIKFPMRLLMRDTPQIAGFETFMSPKDVFGEGEQPTMTQFKLTFGDNVGVDDLTKWLNVRTLSDYLGIPTVDSNIDFPSLNGQVMRFRALDHIAYQWAYDELYRNENVQDLILDDDTDFYSQEITDPVTIDKLMTLRYRNWPKDFFTSALPNTQRGIDVGIPITADVPISFRGDHGVANGTIVVGSTGESLDPGESFIVGLEETVGSGKRLLIGEQSESVVHIDNSRDLVGHLSNVTATINDLRLSVALQSWAEASMRGGARYPEILMSTFGVRPRDARLDRPECMGRISFPLQISEVLQTAPGESSPVGDPAGRGIAYGRGRYIHVFAEEHCLLHAYISIMPRASYQQGLPKRYTKFDKFDYYWPQFDALGEQAIKDRELFYDFTKDWDDPDTNDHAFGYQQRFCEYKAFPNEIHGDFKVSGLNAWHMGRIFANAPALNEDFINYKNEADALNQRVFSSGAVEGANRIWCQVFNRIAARRPMSYNVVPHLKG